MSERICLGRIAAALLGAIPLLVVIGMPGRSSADDAVTPGTCTIRTGATIVDSQPCRQSRAGSVITYTWPKGTRTTVATKGKDVELNDAPATSETGGCYKSSKTGNTFCFTSTTGDPVAQQQSASAAATAGGGASRPGDAPVPEVKPRSAPPPELEIAPDFELSAPLPTYGGKVLFTLDGKRIVTIGNDIRLWDSTTGKQTHQFQGMASVDREPSFAAVSADSRQLLVGHHGGGLFQVLDLSSSKRIYSWRGYGTALDGAFSSSGAMLATVDASDKPQLRDIQTGSELGTIEGMRGGRVRFHPNGALLGSFETIPSDGVEIHLADINSRRLVGKLKGHKSVQDFSFSPDGSHAASSGADGVRLWRITDRSQRAHLEGNGVRFNADGSKMAVHSRKGDVLLWDVAKGSATRLATGPTILAEFAGSKLVTVAFDESRPDGNRSVVPAIVWDVASGEALAQLTGGGGTARKLTVSPDGTQAADATHNAVFVWSLDLEAKKRRQAAARQAEMDRAAAIKSRELALNSLDCTEVKRVDELLKDAPRHGECTFAALLKTGDARELFITAGKEERADQRRRAKQLYEAIVDRFPKDDIALKATEALNALARTEAIEQSNRAASSAVEREGQAQREAIDRASRDASDRQNQARQTFCEGRYACSTSCGSIPSGKSRDYCHDQCRSRFSGC